MYLTPVSTASQSPAAAAIRRVMASAVVLLASAILSGCGGGEGPTPTQTEALPTESEAHRFLTQATFGPTPQDVERVRAVGYARWIDEQFDMPMQSSHLGMVESSARARNAANGDGDGTDVVRSWWTHVVRDPAQLRQRVGFALSQIFVVSTVGVNHGRMVASYMDLLNRGASGRYRDLLESVTLHPAMGRYLSHLANRKEDLTTGRVPDENYAREVMQLFSIGLYQLDDAGRPLRSGDAFIETYTADDVKGLAKVFTGWSWNWPTTLSGVEWWRCFWRTTGCEDNAQAVRPMSPYAQEHSTSARRYLGITSPATTTPDPRASLRQALDRLSNHPNTAPFISRQLIQRLVSSNPSTDYVRDVAAVFRQTDGDLRQVTKAILLHPEARMSPADAGSTYGKLREPLLRMTHLMRALPHDSVSLSRPPAGGALPYYDATETDSNTSGLSQTPMRAPSVFNFYRPGYSAPLSRIGGAGKVSPEMQITTEASVMGYANFVANALSTGWGRWNSTASRFDIQFDTSPWMVQSSQPAALIDAVATRLLGHPLPDDVRGTAIDALSAMPIDSDARRRQRVRAAILLVAVSPDFTVQH